MRVVLLMAALAAAVAPAAVAGGGSSLTITVWPSGTARSRSIYTLACPAATGTLPARRAACRKLARIGARAFAPVPERSVCTMIYGGPQVARVTGSLRGARIRATFTRVNGCETARWNRLAFLFPVRTGP